MILQQNSVLHWHIITINHPVQCQHRNFLTELCCNAIIISCFCSFYCLYPCFINNLIYFVIVYTCDCSIKMTAVLEYIKQHLAYQGCGLYNMTMPISGIVILFKLNMLLKESVIQKNKRLCAKPYKCQSDNHNKHMMWLYALVKRLRSDIAHQFSLPENLL